MEVCKHMVLSGQDNRLENLYKYSIKVSCNAGIALCKGIWIPESGKLLLVQFGTLGFEIRNTAQEIRIPLTIRSRI